jgi:hypothetical protein
MVGNARVLETVIFLIINVLPPSPDISEKFNLRIIDVLIYNIHQIHQWLLITRKILYYFSSAYTYFELDFIYFAMLRWYFVSISGTR